MSIESNIAARKLCEEIILLVAGEHRSLVEAHGQAASEAFWANFREAFEGHFPKPAEPAASEPVDFPQELLEAAAKHFQSDDIRPAVVTEDQVQAFAEAESQLTDSGEPAANNAPSSVWIRGQQYAWKFNGSTSYLELPFAMTAEEVRGLYASLQVAECGQPADHSGDAAEKVEPVKPLRSVDEVLAEINSPEEAMKELRIEQSDDRCDEPEPTERRFVCPRCGNEYCREMAGIERIACAATICPWTGTWAEVEAAKRLKETTPPNAALLEIAERSEGEPAGLGEEPDENPFSKVEAAKGEGGRMANDADGCAAITAAIALTCAIAFGGWRALGFENGREAGRIEMQKEAVEAGHAEYVITDPATGATTFRWKESK